MKTRIALTEFIDDLIYKIVLGNRYLSDAAEMPDSEYKTLRYIHKNHVATMKEIANFCGVSLPRATKIADRLVETGYAERQVIHDRRKVQLALTTKGKQAIDEASSIHQDLSEAILAPLSQKEREQMYMLIKKCHNALLDR